MTMNKSSFAALVFSGLALAACGKKDKEPLPEPLAPAPAAQVAAPVAPTPPAELSDAEREQARRQAQLDYATLEDRYMNDPKGQWAKTAAASSVFGDEGEKTPSESSLAANLIGPPDDKGWTNNHQDIGFDWFQATYDKPVSATEVRVVCANGSAVESLNKIELQDTDGQWHTVWSGLSDVKVDQRGRRTWFVRSFPKTSYKVQSVKVTIANNVERGYKEVNAVQLVGE